ncbi:LysR family transcriptional regulator [Nocardia panacis]|uniref:LysR family transcriptional regulator n=1 Tax=Nocardia panacis TaxID=2340916 RepID=A0A3A4KHJ8_9NOCA|nr:LysR substrate-binding domain-containing protein [Nocardia panacis]RJO73758.1 LysR family transcriptional regulator [Nocardia panacis]
MSSARLLDGRLKLRHLNLVTAIADCGSIVAAAETLFITQPVVSRGLRELEEILGVDLFERGPRGVTPTESGAVFLEHARAVLGQLRLAQRRLEQLARADIGAVTVGTHLAGSNILLPHAISAAKREHPGLTVIVRESTPDLLHAALLAGECDLIVGRLSATAPVGIVGHVLYREPIRLVARVGHPVHELEAPDLRRLAEFPWVFPVEQTELRAELEALFIRENLAIPADRVECTSLPTLRELLLTGDFLAALPMLIAERDERLRLVEFPLPSIRRAVGVSVPAERSPTPAAAALFEQLRAHAAGLDPDVA